MTQDMHDMLTIRRNMANLEFAPGKLQVSSGQSRTFLRGNSGSAGMLLKGCNNLRFFRSLFLLLMMMMTVGVGQVWGAKVTYHIINLGRLDDTTGQPTGPRTEALQFSVSATTVGNSTLEKYKSPLATNWKYYSSSDVSFDSNTKVCTFNGGPSLTESSTLNADAHVYVTYELDEDAFSTVGVFDGGIFRIKFPNDYYLKQTMYNTDVNTNPVKNPGASESEFLWKFNIIDPYQITVQSQSHNTTANCFNYFLSCSDVSNFDDTRLKATLTAAKNTKVWAFGLLNGETLGTYRLVIADGFTGGKSPTNMDSFKHGYLNDNYNKNGALKTTYHRYYVSNSYNNCDLTIESVSANYTFHIINNSGEESMSAETATALNAGATITESMIPDILKSPAACNYSFYPTLADATASNSAITRLPPIDNNIYVRYETSSSYIYLNGGLKYKLSVGGEHHLFAADATTINSAATSGAADTYKWTLHGGDPYKFTIQNEGNSKFITYNVSESEAVTLSGTGSNFFLHQSTSGKYELVVIDSNYPDSYYTLGYGTDGLKLYSNASYSFGQDEIQTVFTQTLTAIIDPLPTGNDLTYNGLEQDLLLTAGTCEHGTIKYREGTTGEFTTTIPHKKDAGTYHVYYMSEGAGDYDNYVAVDPIEVTIAPAPVTVKAEDKTKTYGDSDPTLTATVTGMVNGESSTELISYTFSRADGQDVGNYIITPAGDALQGNYTVTFENGELTINKRTVGITWGETNLLYNGSPQAPTATATNLVYDDKIGITVTGAQTNVGTDYTATASELTGEKAGNYQLPDDKTKTFTIIQADINTTIIMTEWSYGDYDASVNSPSMSFNPDNVEVTYRYKVKGASDETYVAAVPTEVGTYTVKASMPETANSYAITVTKDFTISQKALNKNAGGNPADGITITVSKVITNQGTEQETITYPVTVKHKILGTATTLTPYDAEHPETPYDYTLSGESSVSGYVVTVTAKKEGNVYTGNYTGFAKAAYANPTFYLDGAAWSSSEKEYAAVYLGLFDGLPNLEIGNEIKAYIVNKVNPTIGTVTVSPVESPTKANYIPEGIPVLLLSNKENLSGFTTSSPTEATSDITAAVKYSNKLMIAPNELTDPKDPNSPRGVAVKDAEAYIFYKGEFVLTKEGTIKPDYFFIYNPNYQVQSGDGTSHSARRTLRIVIEGNETGIDEIVEGGNREVQDAAWYSLDGRRLMGKPTKKGLYITNGQKVIVK